MRFAIARDALLPLLLRSCHCHPHNMAFLTIFFFKYKNQQKMKSRIFEKKSKCSISALFDAGHIFMFAILKVQI